MSDSLTTQAPLTMPYNDGNRWQLGTERLQRAAPNSTVSSGSSTDIGRDLRLLLRDELSATRIHEHLVRACLAANTDPHAAQTLAALEAHETDLWDAIGNAQQLR